MQHLSEDGMKLLMHAEGLRREIYCDPAGKQTIGYGHKVLQGEDFSDGISYQEARKLLDNDVTMAEECVRTLVRVPLTQGQFDALVDFVFNLGARRFIDSTLLKLLNTGRYAKAAQQILLWDHAANEVLPGLKARRAAEVALWNGQEPSSQGEAA